MTELKHIRTPLGRVRGFGSAKSGTGAFWHQRVTAIANIPLTIAAVYIMIMLLGRNQPAAAQTLGSPTVTIIMVLFITSITAHMRIGMQVIIEDYVHGEALKVLALLANTFFVFAMGLSGVYAILKIGLARLV